MENQGAKTGVAGMRRLEQVRSELEAERALRTTAPAGRAQCRVDWSQAATLLTTLVAVGRLVFTGLSLRETRALVAAVGSLISFWRSPVG